MAHIGPDALARLQPLLRQLRDIKGIREKQPGIFYLRNAAFAHFHDEAGSLHADLKKPGGSGFDRYPVNDAPQQRKFIDDAKRRARDDEE